MAEHASAGERTSEAGERIRVLIVDDHRLVAEGIALQLERQRDITVVGTVASGNEAVALAAEAAPDVVLMDYHLAEGPGVTATTAIRERVPETAVVFISGDADELAMLAAIEAGASGYLIKTTSGDELAAQIRRAADGEMLMSPDSVRHLMRVRSSRLTTDHVREERVERLTPREREVLQMMGHGLDNAAIATALSISYHTVRGHVQSVLQKLGARSKLEAVAMAHRDKLV